MKILQNYPLSSLTTFKIGGPADYFAAVSTVEQLREALDFARGKKLPVLVVGASSNLLVSDQGFRGMVIQINIKGRQILEEENFAEFKAGAGEVWDDIVSVCVEKQFWGIENLSAIPGFVGGVPIQNVGAYGQEAADTIKSVEIFDLRTFEIKNIGNQECGFGYRQSNFNTIWKDKYAVLSVTFRLSKTEKPVLTYGDVARYFENSPNPSLADIRRAIIEIRKNKFPDLSNFGCAGSFFKNKHLNKEEFQSVAGKIENNFGKESLQKLEEIKKRFSEKHSVKIPVAFLIDLCGLKGAIAGGAKLWEKQSLVIVNTGSAKAEDVIELFNLIKQTVLEKTGVELVNEPELVGF